MSIDRIDGSGLPRRPDQLPRDDSGSGSGDRAEGRSGAIDRIEVSPEARIRASLARAVAELPDIRQERVDLLRAQIASDGYAVDPTEVARAILESEGFGGI